MKLQPFFEVLKSSSMGIDTMTFCLSSIFLVSKLKSRIPDISGNGFNLYYSQHSDHNLLFCCGHCLEVINNVISYLIVNSVSVTGRI